jgi:diguanylate cyclase (GGDEF)-like protein
MIKHLLTLWRSSVSVKLYCIALFSILAVGTLAAASTFFAKVTESAAHRLYSNGFVGVVSSTRLELLLERHRRIVESMPAEVDRARIDHQRTELDEIASKLNALIGDLISENAGSNPASLEHAIAASLPILFHVGDQVIFYARDFAQDKAFEFAERYSDQAERTQAMVRSYREQRLSGAHTAVSRLLASAGSLIIWVSVCTIAAFIFIGPIGLLTTHGVLSRLERLTTSMVTLAGNDTSVAIPSRDDRDEVGEMARAVEVFKRNAIDLLNREVELKQVNQQLDVALNNMTHGLSMFDAEQRLIVCNERYVRMYDMPAELAGAGTTVDQISRHRVSVGNAPIPMPTQLEAESAAASLTEPMAFTQELTDGRIIAVSRQPMPKGGWVSVHEDITERRRAEAKIAHLARHDLLTNLPNRVFFREQLEQAFARSRRGQGFAVLCLDLDHFKDVNDTLGHPIGDELLQTVAARLLKCARETDFVARLGGDEFALVQTALTRPEDCSNLAVRVVEALGQPYDIGGKHVIVTTSIGIALAPADGTDPDQLLKNADLALYRAKADGRGTHRFFEPEMDARLQARRALETDLRAAVAHGEFELHYQPIVDLGKSKTIAMEALIRWRHPARGQIPPLQFIPVAEETGLILPMGEWVIRTACAQAAKWRKPLSVAVNLSPMQFKSRNLVQVVISALATSGLPPQRLEFEITETAFLQNDTATLAVLHQLRGLGVKISMDDFGTGYSSLAYLRSFPFDKIKIDRSFIRDMPYREDCRAIVRAVTNLAQSLKILTVAEGVETVEQLEMALAEGCHECQGYLFGKPMPDAEVARFLAKKITVATAA